MGGEETQAKQIIVLWVLKTQANAARSDVNKFVRYRYLHHGLIEINNISKVIDS